MGTYMPVYFLFEVNINYAFIINYNKL